ncbi:unnamed protein product [Urochloa humidicola]
MENRKGGDISNVICETPFKVVYFILCILLEYTPLTGCVADVQDGMGFCSSARMPLHQFTELGKRGRLMIKIAIPLLELTEDRQI